ncbi:MAG: tetratricopeptide repeat protein [Deltaproteobacteria bacterium]|nr:tetratricopeptide repeat protein [Deltaproteobacteria bacterium]
MHSVRRKKARARATIPDSARKKRLVLEACLVLLLAAGIYQMIRPLRAEWHYRYAKNAVNAIFQKKLDPRKHPEAMRRAVNELRLGLRLAPSNGEMWACMGDLLFFAGHFQESLNSYKTALRYFRSPSLYTNLGVAYAKVKKYDKAEEALKTTLAFFPGHTDAQKALKVVHALRKQ